MTSAGLHAMMDSLSTAMAADPESAELKRAWKATRQAMLAASRREQGIPDPPTAAERITPIGLVCDDLVRKLWRVLNDDRLDRVLDLLDEHRDAVRERDRERIASALDSLAARAGGQGRLNAEVAAMTTTESLEVPWGRTGAADFARDFAVRIRSGGPAEVTVLCRNSTETRWFQELAGPSTAICLLTGREPKTGEHTEKESAMTETAELKAVTIRDVPEEVRTRARWLAAVRGTSMNQVLVDALVGGLPTREQILTEAGETP